MGGQRCLCLANQSFFSVSPDVDLVRSLSLYTALFPYDDTDPSKTRQQDMRYAVYKKYIGALQLPGQVGLRPLTSIEPPLRVASIMIGCSDGHPKSPVTAAPCPNVSTDTEAKGNGGSSSPVFLPTGP